MNGDKRVTAPIPQVACTITPRMLTRTRACTTTLDALPPRTTLAPRRPRRRRRPSHRQAAPLRPPSDNAAPSAATTPPGRPSAPRRARPGGGWRGRVVAHPPLPARPPRRPAPPRAWRRNSLTRPAARRCADLSSPPLSLVVEGAAMPRQEEVNEKESRVIAGWVPAARRPMPPATGLP